MWKRTDDGSVVDVNGRVIRLATDVVINDWSPPLKQKGRPLRPPRERGVSAAYEHPVVLPHVSHFKHVPFRTKVKFPHSPHASPS